METWFPSPGPVTSYRQTDGLNVTFLVVKYAKGLNAKVYEQIVDVR